MRSPPCESPQAGTTSAVGQGMIPAEIPMPVIPFQVVSGTWVWTRRAMAVSCSVGWCA